MKTTQGNFFEDFHLGQTIRHATPRTVTAGDVALYGALYGARFVVQSSAAFAQSVGYATRPVDDLLAFHIVFGKTVPDISLNAVANLGYADGRFLAPVVAGDTLSTVSEVIGLKENSSRQTGVVYVRSTGTNQHGETVIDYVRWVMVRKRDPESPPPRRACPICPTASHQPISARPARQSVSQPGTTTLPAVPTASRTISRASASTMSTASPWRKPSTCWPPASTRTPRGCISIS